MTVIQSCYDTKDILDFFRPGSLYLKPISRLNVSVQLPQLKKSGAKIANWEVMEKVKDMAKPFSFPVFKVAKSSLEFIRFEAEVENSGSMEQVLAKLDMKTIKLAGFQDLLKVRAAEAKLAFPSRSDWDSFFRENKNMNEMRPGERPDTLYIQNLPTKWFLNPQDRSGISRDKPSEFVLRKVFGTFGEIRSVDIPMLDPYREKMKTTISGIQTFTFGQDLVFDAYIQYKEYIGFVKAMNSLKGMKLLYKDRSEDRSWVANIKVDFDKTKHLAESTIKQRAREREKLIQQERNREEAERRKTELEELKRAEEMRKLAEEEKEKERKRKLQNKLKESRRMEREERRRGLVLKKKFQTEDEMMSRKIALEERKLLIAQRKLEAIRLIDELSERVKAVKSRSDNVKSLEVDLLRTAREANKEQRRKSSSAAKWSAALGNRMTYKDQDEKRLRDKLVSRLKEKEVAKMEEQKERLRHAKEGLEDDDDFEDLTDLDSDAETDAEKNRTTATAADPLVEDISDDDLEVEDEDEELRLTTSTEEEEEMKDHEEKESKKKKKKRKKEEKKDKKKKKEEKRKRKELDSHISLAQRIADRDRRSRSLSRERSRTKAKDPVIESPLLAKRGRFSDPEGYPRGERMTERELRKAAKRAQMRAEEKLKEELYDKMMHPHLYGGQGVPSGPHRHHQRIKPGEHYENVQKEFLENEIRIRERREKYKRESRKEGPRDFDFRSRGGREGREGGGPHPHRGGGGYHHRRSYDPPDRLSDHFNNSSRPFPHRSSSRKY